jgi:hypothetical protein
MSIYLEHIFIYLGHIFTDQYNILLQSKNIYMLSNIHKTLECKVNTRLKGMAKISLRIKYLHDSENLYSFLNTFTFLKHLKIFFISKLAIKFISRYVYHIIILFIIYLIVSYLR